MTLSGEEFLRRFLQHVLPRGFHKVRYYGWWRPHAAAVRTRLQQQQLMPPAHAASGRSVRGRHARARVLLPTLRDRPPRAHTTVAPRPRAREAAVVLAHSSRCPPGMTARAARTSARDVDWSRARAAHIPARNGNEARVTSLPDPSRRAPALNVAADPGSSG